MLKAIGKSINIRVSGIQSTKIPIVVLGNSPITESYIKKVDFLKTSGVIQGFWSLNPNPTMPDYIKDTPKNGFETILDPFIGSGTTAVAALKAERIYVGYEINKDYIHLAEKRIEPLKLQTKLVFNTTKIEVEPKISNISEI